MNIANNITELIGNTPLIKLNEPSKRCLATILGKCEFLNPTSSVKDRIGFNMIRRALENGDIDKDTVVIEPTSGNTGIALAANCAALGIKLILTMPDSMSIERRKLLKALGAELVLTPASLGMKGSIQKANELKASYKKAIVLQQFQNPNNPQIHELTTAKEILRDTDKNIDAFVSAVGTGGTLTGTSRVLKKEVIDIKVFAVEPKDSAILSGKSPSPHKI
jgi:cysteine synthase A